jgi:hypothetical protein
MSQTALIVVAIVVVVAVVLVAIFASRTRRRGALRDRFGGEYDRAVAETGSAGKAESLLSERVKRREALEIRDLEPRARERYSETWRSVQAHFVDDPHGAVREADDLVMAVMRDRGYPTSDFDQQAGDLSVDHAGVIDNSRKAHEISLAGERGEASTDELRQAMVHYRALFDELLGGQGNVPPAPSVKSDEPDGPMPEKTKSETARSESEPAPAEPAPAEPAPADDMAIAADPEAETPVSKVAAGEAAPGKSE